MEDNTIKIISFKTGITAQRLKSLKLKSNAISLAHELLLIELATKKNLEVYLNFYIKTLY
mgnify:CR=1 FL=1